MHAGIIFFLVILGSVLFHIFTPWYWTDVASNWGGMDDTITLTFWVGGGVFVAVCLFMVWGVFLCWTLRVLFCAFWREKTYKRPVLKIT